MTTNSPSIQECIKTDPFLKNLKITRTLDVTKENTGSTKAAMRRTAQVLLEISFICSPTIFVKYSPLRFAQNRHAKILKNRQNFLTLSAPIIAIYENQYMLD